MIILVSDDSRVLDTGTQAAPVMWPCSSVSAYHLLHAKALSSLWIDLMMISTSSCLMSQKCMLGFMDIVQKDRLERDVFGKLQ